MRNALFICINNGNPGDFSVAQNGPIIDSRRDVGACEVGAGVGLKNIVIFNTLKVYPNPTNSYFTLEVKNLKNKYSLFMFSSSGKLVYNKKDNLTDIVNIDISHLPKGLYFLLIESNGISKTRKIIKQ